MQVRLATVGPLLGTRAVSGVSTVTRLERHAERLGDDLAEERRRALAELGRAREHAELAVARQRDGRAAVRYTSPLPVKPAPWWTSARPIPRQRRPLVRCGSSARTRAARRA